MAAKTADPFAIQNVAIDSIVPHERNPNQGDVGAVATAIAVDGWHGTILCQAPTEGRAEPRIVAGHTRWRALAMLQEHGYTYPEGGHLTYEELAARVPLPPAGTVPVQQLPMDDVRATRKMLADNRASALAMTDDTEMADLLSELAAADELFASLFEGDDVDAMMEEIERNGAGFDTTNEVQTPQDRLADYAAAGIRSIILPMEAAEYDALVGRLNRLRSVWDLESNTAVVVRAVSEAATDADD